MEFIDYDDIEAVKAGVQEAGMIMGGDYLFKFYLVIFTKDDRDVIFFHIISKTFHKLISFFYV